MGLRFKGCRLKMARPCPSNENRSMVIGHDVWSYSDALVSKNDILGIKIESHRNVGDGVVARNIDPLQ
jgi:hypothetical protein